MDKLSTHTEASHNDIIERWESCGIVKDGKDSIQSLKRTDFGPSGLGCTTTHTPAICLSTPDHLFAVTYTIAVDWIGALIDGDEELSEGIRKILSTSTTLSELLALLTERESPPRLLGHLPQ